MDQRPVATDASQDLCTRCGLCCTGVLFEWVVVQEKEVDSVAALGLPVTVREDGRQGFDQPCPMFSAGCCSVYAERPISCRRFRCELLKKVDAGETTPDEGRRIIAEAKGLIERLAEFAPSDPHPAAIGSRWWALFREWKSRSPTERVESVSTRLLLHMTVVNRFLDRHFRSPNSKWIMED